VMIIEKLSAGTPFSHVIERRLLVLDTGLVKDSGVLKSNYPIRYMRAIKDSHDLFYIVTYIALAAHFRLPTLVLLGYTVFEQS